MDHIALGAWMLSMLGMTSQLLSKLAVFQKCKNLSSVPSNYIKLDVTESILIA